MRSSHKCDHAVDPSVALYARERIDNTAKQHRLGKLRDGQRQIGERQIPAYSAVSPEVFENTAVKAKRIHLASGPRPSFVYWFRAGGAGVAGAGGLGAGAAGGAVQAL